MNASQFTLLIDAISFLISYYCFTAMAQGRREITGETQPEQPRSEQYAAANDWRM